LYSKQKTIFKALHLIVENYL